MKTLVFIVFVLAGIFPAFAGSELFDIEAVRDPATLERKVLQDWQPSPKDPQVRQKLIEITVCEWWDGQKVRLPVTLNAPVSDSPTTNVIVANQPLRNKAALPAADQLDLLKSHGVGVVLIGMGTIDAMEPKGQLHIGMKKHLLATKDPRYTPAWIWGMSQMRALTAALTEPGVFRPGKVLTTGGSKRGVASAVAGIHDDRFTAIMPVVAPPLGNPGAAHYIIGKEPGELLAIDKRFYAELKDAGIANALRERAERRAAKRGTLKEARAANWTAADMEAITDRAWDASRVASQWQELKKRGLDIFYNAGTNDSVTPSLIELGKRFPGFPVSIVPGGQHGGPATAGFTTRVPVLPETRANFVSFAKSHFFGDRKMIDPPVITCQFDRASKQLAVTTEFPEGTSPESNRLWWIADRSQPYTLTYEYDKWESVEMEKIGPGRYTAAIEFDDIPHRVDYISRHTHTENALPLTVSSPCRRLSLEKTVVALIGDSTVTDSAGWGKAFANHFGDNVVVKNFAMGGRSSKSWLAEDRMQEVRDAMPDYMLIQFGHNGQPGKGPRRETDPATTYREYLKVYIDEARMSGAVPILLSPVTRRDFSESGKIRTDSNLDGPGRTRPLKPRADAAKALANELGVSFIDLYQLSVEHHNETGEAVSATYSPKEGDITHFNEAGAVAISGLIVDDLKKVEPNLAVFLKDK
ncbi:MAG: GDSL-type esterase/lipase family protein [Verrucomicrobiales bacterium]|nr:GDSL-type esterase/lipase family protein [Verrucomicrobiales bacterium]